MNYKRLRFFPVIKSNCGKAFFTASLGIIAKFFKKGKSFLKKKLVYMTLFSLIRKLLLYSSINNLTLIINRIPRYYQEFISTMYKPSIAFYKHPFNNHEIVNESSKLSYFSFSYVYVQTHTSYGYIKPRKRGKLKRKIKKKLILSNRVID